MPDKAVPGPGLAQAVVFGEALTDFIRTGPDSWRHRAGGACWNVARVLARLGLSSGFAGAVSTDPFGQELLALTQAAGLRMAYTQVHAGDPLLAMVHRVDPPAYFFCGENAADLRFQIADMPPGWERAIKLAHFGSISLAREPLASQLESLAVRLGRQGVRISFDPNWRQLMGPSYRQRFELMLQTSDWIKISDEDLAHLLPELDGAAALRWVLDRAGGHSGFGRATVLLTRGSQGLQVWSPSAAGYQSEDVPAFEIEVADTVGAGDASIGGWIFSCLTWPGRSPAEHGRFAAATAALACTKAGAWAPSLKAVEEFLG